MHYYDRVYGDCSIHEPVILDLIQSPSLQRLRFIDQGGYRPLWAKQVDDIGEEDHTRFAHSLGVYLLLRQYGAPLEEQIAGLIHDVSHSAFSHCIDYVLEGGNEQEQSHQDNLFDSFVKRSDIPDILHSHGFDVQSILDESRFPLKERTLPDLCADRIDYSLRTAVLFHELEPEGARALLDRLTVCDNHWVFKTFASAQQYTRLFCMLNKQYYSGLSSAVMFRAVGDCLRHALQRGYITEIDLYTTDPKVLAKIHPHLSNDPHLHVLWECMNNKRAVSVDPSFAVKQVFCKSRAVDPLWMSPKGIQRVSDIDHEWRGQLSSESNPKEHRFSFCLA